MGREWVGETLALRGPTGRCSKKGVRIKEGKSITPQTRVGHANTYEEVYRFLRKAQRSGGSREERKEIPLVETQTAACIKGEDQEGRSVLQSAERYVVRGGGGPINGESGCSSPGGTSRVLTLGAEGQTRRASGGIVRGPDQMSN